MQTIINAHAHKRGRYIRRQRATHKAHRVVGVGVGVLAVEVALAAEMFIEASMAPVWFPLMLSLCKPCSGRDNLCVQEVQARGRNESTSHPRPSIVTRVLFRSATRRDEKDCGSDAEMRGFITAEPPRGEGEGASKTAGLQETARGEDGGGRSHRENGLRSGSQEMSDPGRGRIVGKSSTAEQRRGCTGKTRALGEALARLTRTSSPRGWQFEPKRGEARPCCAETPCQTMDARSIQVDRQSMSIRSVGMSTLADDRPRPVCECSWSQKSNT